MTIIGLDIGHAETAACRVVVGDHAEPQTLELAPGQRSIPTAVATAAGGGTLIGSEAILSHDARDLALAFKSTDMRGAADAVERFARGVRERLAAIGVPGDAEHVVGVPSAWERLTRIEYETLLRRAGLTRLRLIAESRAALLSAGVSYEEAKANVLVIDVGSSTTDVTFLANLALDADRPREMGHNGLGGGLIDEALLAAMLERSRQREAIAAMFARDRSARPRALFAVRKTKEEYFTNEAIYREHPLVKAHYVSVRPERLLLDIEIDRALIEDVISRPATFSHTENAAPEKQRTLSWQQAYRELLSAARSDPRIGIPQTIVLTGGASRMGFVQAITRETFVGAAKLVIGAEPELAIARGLALAGRIDVQTVAFAADAERSFTAETIERAVRARYPDWQDRVARLYGEAVCSALAASMRAWRDSPDDKLTLEDVQREVGATFNAWVGAPDTQLELARTFVSWSNDVMNDLRADLVALMGRHQIPIAQVTLNPIAPRAAMPDESLWVFRTGDRADVAVTVVAASLAGMIGFGVDAMLVVTAGAVGMIATALGVLVGPKLPGRARGWLMGAQIKAYLPRWVLASALADAAIDALVRAQKPSLVSELSRQLGEGATRSRTERAIEEAVRTALGKVEAQARLEIAGA